jgi:multimeric flavodoxin WrbA
MNVLIISASNMLHQNKERGTSYEISTLVSEGCSSMASERCILELREFDLRPCVGCGKCYTTRRCACDRAFNKLYEQIICCDALFIVAPHYAPIPAKLSMLLEKMEQITFLHWGRNAEYRSEVFGIPAGVISHGGGSDQALPSYKAMVNDTIANALDTIQIQLIPFSDTWNTGIALPVSKVSYESSKIFPIQEYDWKLIGSRVFDYVSLVLSAVKEDAARNAVKR